MIKDHDTRLGKARLRKKYKQLRADRHRQGTLKDGKRLAENFMESVSFASPTIVSGYWPILSEIDIRPLLKSLHGCGNAVCLPTIVSHQLPLKFRQWSPSDRLQRAAFNTFEPNETKPQMEPEVVIVPLLAFDNKGHRLGYGGGYYDRTLDSFGETKIVTVGVGYEMQFVERVPAGRNDVALHWIVTEKRSRNARCRIPME